MKRFFSVFLICLILLFSTCFAYDSRYLPSNQLDNAINNNTGNIDIRSYYELACQYFFSDSLHRFNVNLSGYSYMIFPSAPANGTTVRFEYHGVFDNNEIVITGANEEDNRVAWSAVDSNGNYISNGFNYITGSITFNLSDSSVNNSSALHTNINSNGGYSSLARFTYPGSTNNGKFISYANTVSAFSESVFSSTGYLRQINNDVISNFLNSVHDSWTSSDSTDYYIVNNVNKPLNNNPNGIINYNGTNYYDRYNFEVGFTDYFRNYVSIAANLYYSIVLDGVDNAIVYRREVSNPYNLGSAYFTFTEGIASQLSSNTGYLVLEYKTSDGDYTGRATYAFSLVALPSQPLPITNSYDSYHTPSDVSDVIYNTTINVDNGTYNPTHGDYDPTFDPLDYNWTNYFSSIFDFFKVAFAWLPSEIINIVSTGFFILMGVMIYKFFRG